jgi:hypothetical protein
MPVSDGGSKAQKATESKPGGVRWNLRLRRSRMMVTCTTGVEFTILTALANLLPMLPSCPAPGPALEHSRLRLDFKRGVWLPPITPVIAKS